MGRALGFLRRPLRTGRCLEKRMIVGTLAGALHHTDLFDLRGFAEPRFDEV